VGTLIDTDDERILTSRLFDCRSALTDADYGITQYGIGHLQGALFADLNHNLSGPIIPGQTGRHPLPEKQHFLTQVQAWGIRNEDTVVIYDDDSGAFAARMWWMMRWLGHEDVYVLDGGFKCWVGAGNLVTTDAPSVEPSDFRPGPSLTRQIEAAQIPEWQGLIFDARDPVRFRGESEPIDPVAGHIPGALNAPFQANLTRSGFRNVAELRSHYSDLGAADQDVVCYCGSGVTAAHLILAMCHSGFDEPALYPGSWSEWVTDPNRPVE
jgi:thiosulfate/3-mercaptopyruvate sulfurtransferase